MKLQFFNTLGRQKQVFEAIAPHKAGMYTCGQTVYDYPHIGNMRTYLFEDFLKRILMYNSYEVTHIMNITDVGHLVSDADEGEDKMEKGSARTGKSVWEIADYYTKAFIDDVKLLNIIPATKYTKATDYIKEQIDMIKCLEDKGFTYITSDGVYFDTSKLSDYGKLAQIDVEGLEEGKRIEFSAEKRNKTDFALWKFSPKDTKRQMEWKSPWGIGFPGWHIECSAMSRKFLGDTFDIHCGGIDHIPIHHTNEIAQSEACTGKPFAHYWLHGAFLEEDDGKMSKSKGEFLCLKTLTDKGYSPLDYRYMCLGTHYRKRLLFSWDVLDSAKNSFNRLKQNIIRMKEENAPGKSGEQDRVNLYKSDFLESVNDDLNMPQALAVTWEVVRNTGISDKNKLELIYDFDRVLGLELKKFVDESRRGQISWAEFEIPDAPIKQGIPSEVLELINKRAEAKAAKNFKLADELRNKVRELGYVIIDKKGGVEVKEIKN
ncbi:MAG: cysteine--tRNA ligase [Chlorobi bacterium]|nr:cysteine--tRNA ligase [Chlorobiota bacterium]MCI0716578.1 cysteine--tRNA ligase [Chlorobiota bacterium]